MKRVVIAKGLEQLFPEKDSFLDRTEVGVAFAATHDEMLGICSKEPVDLIVTKLGLPGMRCENFIETLRADDKMRNVSIIILSEDTLAHRERIKHCKANAVFATPVEARMLHLKMQQFLNVAPRLVYRATLAVAVEGKFRSQPLPFWTENISESGMLIRTEEPLVKGAGVFLSFFLYDGTHVTGYGEIVRVQRLPEVTQYVLYGVKFTNIDEEAKTAIRTVVAKKRRNIAT